MRAIPTVLLVLVTVFSAVLADVELTLRDGQVVRGVDVTVRDGQYLLELESDDVM
jgi:hypothetical protein